MGDVAPLVLTFGLGALISGTGVFVYLGHGVRLGPEELAGRPAVMVSGGLVLVMLSAGVAAGDVGVELLVPVCFVVACFFALASMAFAAFGVPRWAQPSWQRSLKER